MKKIIQIPRVIALLVVMLAFACTEDSTTDSTTEISSGGDVEMLFNFEIEQTQSATRAVQDDASDTQTLIKNMWIVQYDASGSYIDSYYNASFSTTDGVMIYADTETIVFLANTFDPTLISSGSAATIDDLKDMTISVSGNNSVLGSDGTDQYIMMYGTIAVFDQGTNSTVSLKSNAARIKVKIIETIEDVDIAAIETVNLPTVSYLYNVAEATATFPTNATYKDYSWSTDEITAATTSDDGYTIYLPVNMCGTVDSNVTTSDKSANAPENATAIRLQFPMEDTFYTTRAMTFYLGADMINDYNLKANHGYTLTLTISSEGNSTDDARIEIVDIAEEQADDGYVSIYNIRVTEESRKFNMQIKNQDATSEAINLSTALATYSFSGDGDRVPTLDELAAMYIFYSTDDTAYNEGGYLTSTRYEGSVIAGYLRFNISEGFASVLSDSSSALSYIRLVKDFK